MWPQSLGLFHSETEPSHLVVDEVPGTWGQSFVFALINLATTSHPPMCGSLGFFSWDPMEGPYFYQQQNHLETLKKIDNKSGLLGDQISIMMSERFPQR